MSAVASRADVRAPEGVARLLGSVRDDRRPVGLGEHQARYGPLPLDPELAGVADAAGLLGRGGAAFPTGRKLDAVRAAGGRPVVVANAAEGEPASAKDRTLLRHVPHLVLDGAVAAAAAVGARDVVLAVGPRVDRDVLAAALHERRERVRWRIAPVPQGFVVGEETALLRAVAGKPPKPTTKPPYPFERGLDGRPTLVQNVETLAQLALVARFGPRWFRALGTPAEPGTALVTVRGAVARPGVHELELGEPIAALVARAGGETEPVGAYLVGGYFGGWTRDRGTQLLAAEGTLGAGVVVALPARGCGLLESARVARYLARESAGQCGPCVHGLAALADGLERVAAGHGEAGERERLARWAREVTGRGACRHPDGAARFVSSSLAAFADEVDEHLRHGRCHGRDLGVLRTGDRR